MTIWDYSHVSWDLADVVSKCSTCLLCRSALQKMPARYRELEERNLDGSVTPAVCPSCGWWTVTVLKQDIVPTIYWEPHPEDIMDDGAYRSSRTSGALGSLRELDLANIEQPLQNVRDYLALK